MTLTTHRLLDTMLKKYLSYFHRGISRLVLVRNLLILHAKHQRQKSDVFLLKFSSIKFYCKNHLVSLAVSCPEFVYICLLLIVHLTFIDLT